MSLDPELLKILVCPKTHGELEVVDLPDDVQQMLIEKYREHFRDEEPVAEKGLYCRESALVYPVIGGSSSRSLPDIPIMLEDDALDAASVLGSAADAAGD